MEVPLVRGGGKQYQGGSLITEETAVPILERNLGRGLAGEAQDQIRTPGVITDSCPGLKGG